MKYPINSLTVLYNLNRIINGLKKYRRKRLDAETVYYYIVEYYGGRNSSFKLNQVMNALRLVETLDKRTKAKVIEMLSALDVKK